MEKYSNSSQESYGFGAGYEKADSSLSVGNTVWGDKWYNGCMAQVRKISAFKYLLLEGEVVAEIRHLMERLASEGTAAKMYPKLALTGPFFLEIDVRKHA